MLIDKGLEEVREIFNNRGLEYGKVEDSFDKIKDYWNIYINSNFLEYEQIKLNQVDVCNLMILLKVARNRKGYYKQDNFIDISGYSLIANSIIESEIIRKGV
jgi:hypothetical protein